VDFPSLQSQQLLRVLLREPLGYEIVRQKGSHRRLESSNGYPVLGFSFHNGVTVPGGAVKKILVKDVGLDEDEAKALI
jgi:predicted RNA binding protein YcfA (HicA-like mRNA interferase family)